MSTVIGAVPTPQELADRAAITDILHLHSRGLDRQDASLLEAAYWPDANVDYGSFVGPAMQFAPWLLVHWASSIS